MQIRSWILVPATLLCLTMATCAPALRSGGAPPVPACGVAPEPTSGIAPAVAPACGAAPIHDDVAARDVVISLEVTGSMVTELKFRHVGDAQHFCATSAEPWAHVDANGQSLEVPPGPPKYELVYNDGNEPSAPHFHLSAFNYRLGVVAHNDPADDWIDFSAGGKEWIGHGISADPAFQLEIKFGPDGNSGSFVALHLRAANNGTASPGNDVVDVRGAWLCPFGAPPAPSP